MKASELVSRISALIAEHGDRAIVFDCDCFLAELGSVALLDEPFLDAPVFLISPPSPPADFIDANIHAPRH